jgi:hypothetical protein
MRFDKKEIKKNYFILSYKISLCPITAFVREYFLVTTNMIYIKKTILGLYIT